jgi:hypothetical protein
MGIHEPNLVPHGAPQVGSMRSSLLAMRAAVTLQQQQGSSLLAEQQHLSVSLLAAAAAEAAAAGQLRAHNRVLFNQLQDLRVRLPLSLLSHSHGGAAACCLTSCRTSGCGSLSPSSLTPTAGQLRAV